LCDVDLNVQVLDDSTDRITRELVDDKLMEWLEHGIDIEVLRRTNRAGYKAGALKEVLALGWSSATPCQHLQDAPLTIWLA